MVATLCENPCLPKIPSDPGPQPRAEAKSKFLSAAVAILFALSAYASAANPLEIITDAQPNGGTISPDGKTITCKLEGRVKVFDTATGKELATLPIGPGDMAYSPDGKYFVIADENDPKYVTRVFNAATWELKRELKDQTKGTNFLRISADSKRLMVVSVKDLYVWNIETGELLVTIAPTTDKLIVSAVISSDGKTVQMMDGDRTLRSVDLATKKETTVPLAESGAYSIPVPSAGRVVERTSGLKIIDSTTGKTLPLQGKDPRLLTATPYPLLISPDEKSILTSVWLTWLHGTDSRYVLWDLASASMKSLSDIMPKPHNGLWLSGNGKRAFAACLDGSIRVIDVATMKETQSFANVYPPNQGVNDNTDRYRLMPSYDGSILAYFDALGAKKIKIFTIK